MSAGFSALSRALFALAWTIPDNLFITLMLVVAFLLVCRHRSEHVGTRSSRAGGPPVPSGLRSRCERPWSSNSTAEGVVGPRR